MEFVKEFINEYGTQILMTILTAIAGALGIVAKNIYKRVADDKTKKAVAEICVKAVEQIYKDLTGSERYDKCVEAMSDMLEEKGISISDLEIKMLIESAVGEFNDVFKDSGNGDKNSDKNGDNEIINEGEVD